jgi:hypothetical protein
MNEIDNLIQCLASRRKRLCMAIGDCKKAGVSKDRIDALRQDRSDTDRLYNRAKMLKMSPNNSQELRVITDLFKRDLISDSI